MKTLLLTIYTFIMWSVVMVVTVAMCVFIENGLSIQIDEKSDNLVLYWIVGAFVYPVIRSFKGKSQKPDDKSKEIELEKEQQLLEREQKAFELKQKQKEQELLQKENYTRVCEAIQKNNLSHQFFLDETQALKSNLNIVENKLFDLENSLNEIKQRNEILLTITGADDLITNNRKKLKSLNTALNTTQTLLIKE